MEDVQTLDPIRVHTASELFYMVESLRANLPFLLRIIPARFTYIAARQEISAMGTMKDQAK